MGPARSPEAETVVGTAHVPHEQAQNREGGGGQGGEMLGRAVVSQGMLGEGELGGVQGSAVELQATGQAEAGEPVAVA